MGNACSSDDSAKVGFVSSSATDREISMGGDDAGDQGQSQTCGIYSLNNVLEDALRSEHGISDYDAKAGALMMRDQKYTYNGSLIEDVGTTIENLIQQVNDSIENDGMVLPTKDGRGVTLTLDCEYSQGPDGADPGDIVLAKEYDGRGNHFMEVASFDGTTITTQNSWAGQMQAQVPDDDTFEEALGTYKIIITDVASGGQADTSDNGDSGDWIYYDGNTSYGPYYYKAEPGYDAWKDGYYWYPADGSPDDAQWYAYPQQ
jgi:hypothetical protein